MEPVASFCPRTSSLTGSSSLPLVLPDAVTEDEDDEDAEEDGALGVADVPSCPLLLDFLCSVELSLESECGAASSLFLDVRLLSFCRLLSFEVASGFLFFFSVIMSLMPCSLTSHLTFFCLHLSSKYVLSAVSVDAAPSIWDSEGPSLRSSSKGAAASSSDVSIFRSFFPFFFFPSSAFSFFCFPPSFPFSFLCFLEGTGSSSSSSVSRRRFFSSVFFSLAKEGEVGGLSSSSSSSSVSGAGRGLKSSFCFSFFFFFFSFRGASSSWIFFFFFFLIGASVGRSLSLSLSESASKTSLFVGRSF